MVLSGVVCSYCEAGRARVDIKTGQLKQTSIKNHRKAAHMKRFILQRLKEPTTYIGAAFLLKLVGVPAESVNEALTVASGVCAALGVALPEAQKQ